MASEAVLSKEQLEGLAFAVMVKMTFRSSRINNPAIRNLMQIFHMGSTKTSRVLKNAVKHGYVRYDGRTIVALPVKTSGEYVCKLTFDVPVGAVCPMKIKDVVSDIRAAIVLNHIRKQDDCGNTFKALDTGMKDGGRITARQLKTMRSKQSRMSYSKSFHEGLSNSRVMKLTNTKRYSERKLMNRLTASGMIKRETCIEETGISPSAFGELGSLYMREIGFGGWFFRRGNTIYCQRTNIYSYNSDVICKSRSYA